jgi:hypothetical protein
MSDRSEREERAFDALIVSHLLRDRDLADLDDLPDLTESERAAMNATPEDMVEQLWAVEDERTPDEAAEEDFSGCVAEEEEEEEFAAMNRGESMDEETKHKLDLARKEVLEMMRRQKKGDQDAKR